MARHILRWNFYTCLFHKVKGSYRLLIMNYIFLKVTNLVACSSEPLTTNHEDPGSIPGSALGFSLAEEDPHSDHGLGSL
jgi:hypothetical protein